MACGKIAHDYLAYDEDLDAFLDKLLHELRCDRKVALDAIEKLVEDLSDRSEVLPGRSLVRRFLKILKSA